MARGKKKTNIKKYADGTFVSTFCCQGHGTFHSKGKGNSWTSHHAAVVYELTLPPERVETLSLREGDVEFREIYRFGQKSKLDPNGPYIRPFFPAKEVNRMKKKLAKRFMKRIQSYHGSRVVAPNEHQPLVAEVSKNQPPHISELCERCKFHPGACGVIEVVEGVFFQVVDSKAFKERSKMLKDLKSACKGGRCIPKSCRRLYHQTDEDIANIILETQEMKRGAVGLFGGGIYFAASPEETVLKAHRKGVILECIVYLGNPYQVHAPQPEMTFKTLTDMKDDARPGVQFHSLHGKKTKDFLRSGDEYVVYNKDQVLHIRKADRGAHSK